MNWFVPLCTAVKNTAAQSFTTHCMIFSGAAVSGSSAASSGSATGWQEETGEARGCWSQSRVVRCWKVRRFTVTVLCSNACIVYPLGSSWEVQEGDDFRSTKSLKQDKNGPAPGIRAVQPQLHWNVCIVMNAQVCMAHPWCFMEVQWMEMTCF